MEFTPDDYKSMMFPVYEIPEGTDLLKKFPELTLYDEFKKPIRNLDKNKMIRYIFYVYDKKSPYRIKYKDLLERKVHAMIDAGYAMEGQEFDSDVEDVLYAKNDPVNDMCIAFLKMHNDHAYSHLILVETMYYQKMKDVFIGRTDKINELNAIKKSMQEAQEEVLMGDQSRGMVRSLSKFLNRDKLTLSPEKIARSIKDKGLANTISDLDGPY